MENILVILLSCAAVLYASASLAYIHQLRIPAAEGHPLLPFFVAGSGLLMQTALLGLTAVETSGTQLGGANILMLASWSAMVIYFIFELVSKRRSFGAFILPLVLASMVTAWAMGAGGVQPQGMAIYSSWPLLVVHIVAYFVAATVFLFGGASSALYLYQERLLKVKLRGATETPLPGLSFLKKVMRRTAPIGLPILAFGLILGIIRVIGLEVPGWWVSPRIILSLTVFVVYCVITAQAYVIKASARTLAGTHILGSGLVIVLMIFSAILPMLGTW